MATVLWGRRRGDVQYGSRAYWRTRIPIGAQTIATDVSYWEPYDVVELVGPGDPDSWDHGPIVAYRIVGRDPERGLLGVTLA